MKTRIVLAISTLALAGMFSGATIATPSLQLDIVGGTYNGDEENMEIDSDIYTVRALQNYDGFNNATFYLSIALTTLDGDSLSESASGDYGTISIDSIEYHVTDDMIYGTPPADEEIGDLASHGVFPTWYLELDFEFDESNTIKEYDVANVTTANPRPEPCTSSSCEGDPLYFRDFLINAENLSEGHGLHYDLYAIGLNPSRTSDYKIVDKAPFSHDASGYPGDGGDGTDGGDSCNPEDPFDACEVPEPTTLWLFALALLVTSLYRAAPRATSRKF